MLTDELLLLPRRSPCRPATPTLCCCRRPARHNNHHAFEFSAAHSLEWWQFDALHCLIRRVAGWSYGVALAAPAGSWCMHQMDSLNPNSNPNSHSNSMS